MTVKRASVLLHFTKLFAILILIAINSISAKNIAPDNLFNILNSIEDDKPSADQIKQFDEYIKAGGDLRIKNNLGYDMLYLLFKTPNKTDIIKLLLSSTNLNYDDLTNCLDISLVSSHYHYAELMLDSGRVTLGFRDLDKALNRLYLNYHFPRDIGEYNNTNSITEKDFIDFLEFLKTGNPSVLNQNDERDGETLLMKAVNQPVSALITPGIVKYLIDNGADVNATNKYGRSVLAIALNNSSTSYDTIKVLINAGASISPIHGDILTGKLYKDNDCDPELAQLLIDNGIKIDATNGYGCTALILAAFYGDYDLAERLIDNGADKSLKDHNGLTALEYADKYNWTKISKLLGGKGTAPDYLIEETSENNPCIFLYGTHNQIVAIKVPASFYNKNDKTGSISFFIPSGPDKRYIGTDKFNSLGRSSGYYKNISKMPLLCMDSEGNPIRDKNGSPVYLENKKLQKIRNDEIIDSHHKKIYKCKYPDNTGIKGCIFIW